MNQSERYNGDVGVIERPRDLLDGSENTYEGGSIRAYLEIVEQVSDFMKDQNFFRLPIRHTRRSVIGDPNKIIEAYITTDGRIIIKEEDKFLGSFGLGKRFNRTKQREYDLKKISEMIELVGGEVRGSIGKAKKNDFDILIDLLYGVIADHER